MSDTTKATTTTRTTSNGTKVTETRHADGSIDQRSVMPDGTVKEITQHTDENGAVHSTGTQTNPDGSVDTQTSSRVHNEDGTSTTTSNFTTKGGAVSVNKETVKQEDGSSVTTEVRREEDDTVRSSTSTTSADGKVVTTEATKTDAQGNETSGTAQRVTNDDGSSTTTRTTTTDEGEEKIVIERKDENGKLVKTESTVFHDDGSKSIDTTTHQASGSKRDHHTEVDANGNSVGNSTLTRPDGTTESAATDREVTDDGKVDTVFKTEGDEIIGTRTTYDKDGNKVSTATYDPETELFVNDGDQPTAPNGDAFTGTDMNGVLVDAETGDTFNTKTGERTFAETGETFQHDRDPETGEFKNEGTWTGPDGSKGTFTNDSYEGSNPDGETFRASGPLLEPGGAVDPDPDAPILTLETGNENEPGSNASTDHYSDGSLTTSQQNGDTYHRDGFLIDNVAGYDPATDSAPGGGAPLDAELDELAGDTYDDDRSFDELIDGLIEDPSSQGDAQQAAQAGAGTTPTGGSQGDGSGSGGGNGGSSAEENSAETEPQAGEGNESDSNASSTDNSSEDESDDDSDSSEESTSSGGDGSEATDSTEEEPEDSGGESEQGREGDGVAGGQDFDPEKLREMQGIELPDHDPWDDPSFEALAQPGEGQSGPTPDVPIEIDAPEGEIDMPEEFNQPDPERDPLDLVSQPATNEDDAIESVGAFEQSEKHFEQVSNPGNMMTIDGHGAAPGSAIETDVSFGSGAAEPTAEPATSAGQPEAPSPEPEAAPATFAEDSGFGGTELIDTAPPELALDTGPTDLSSDTLTGDVSLSNSAPLVDEPLDDLTLEG